MPRIILNSKDRKHILAQLREEFGIESLPEGVFFCVHKREKVYFISRAIFDIEVLDELRINAMGMYFGTFMKDGFRLSLEGLHMLKDQITKNIMDVDLATRDAWLRGEDLEVKEESDGCYVVIRYENDYHGIGRHKGTKVLNYLPKARQLRKIISYENN